MVRNFLLLVFILLSVFFTIGCGFDAFYDTVYPAYLQTVDKVAVLTDFTNLEALETSDYSMRMRSFSFPSGREFLCIQIRFSSEEDDDVLLVYTSSLLFVSALTKQDFGLGSGYVMSQLLAEADSEKILIGFDYQGSDGGEGPKLVAFDPTGASPPIIQDDSAPSSPSYVQYLTGVPYDGNILLITSVSPNLRFSGLTTDLSDAGMESDVQVFQNSYTSYEFSDLVYESDSDVFYLSILNYGQAWVVALPAGILFTPPVVGSYPTRFFSDVQDSQSIFSTRDGVVTAPLGGKWTFYPWTGGSESGPDYQNEKDIQARYFTSDGKYYFFYDDQAKKLFRAKTWW